MCSRSDTEYLFHVDICLNASSQVKLCHLVDVKHIVARIIGLVFSVLGLSETPDRMDLFVI